MDGFRAPDGQKIVSNDSALQYIRSIARGSAKFREVWRLLHSLSISLNQRIQTRSCSYPISTCSASLASTLEGRTKSRTSTCFVKER